ncbi:hypothetical protein J6590_057936 [Homalodisca vitripennis]|nr:hypothetical protein J6590_057936 [Homalodisca vitripennis]
MASALPQQALVITGYTRRSLAKYIGGNLHQPVISQGLACGTEDIRPGKDKDDLVSNEGDYRVVISGALVFRNYERSERASACSRHMDNCSPVSSLSPAKGYNNCQSRHSRRDRPVMSLTSAAVNWVVHTRHSVP